VTAVTLGAVLVAAKRSSDEAFAASAAFVASPWINPLSVCSDEMNELVVVSLFLSRVCGTPSTLISELMRSVVLRPLTRPSIARLVLEDTDEDIVDTPWRRGGGQDGEDRPPGPTGPGGRTT
jgi:hypothetical protein